MIFAHPQACYFAVGRISDEQLADYAQRRGTTPPELKKYLSRNIE
jgi:5-methyltetrahydrofolate--homocysteine methyltransferase